MAGVLACARVSCRWFVLALCCLCCVVPWRPRPKFGEACTVCVVVWLCARECAACACVCVRERLDLEAQAPGWFLFITSEKNTTQRQAPARSCDRNPTLSATSFPDSVSPFKFLRPRTVGDKPRRQDVRRR
ncbi:hypothetical protein BGZ61DRAFT_27446 [Ilyonectria robusta]|uniref:uncharacterized protein n=1 Tax=Ilyonectria robusta TaxID=1079257 RepID=UPI001E8D3398|nr:uncharacterized protein BGZ61DRAFT_27446 [Ilyonectria robusta]KAH8738070.1 hypothetical protein BGZ61DRAFT_27446 [Ilyonectria robusta]